MKLAIVGSRHLYPRAFVKKVIAEHLRRPQTPEEGFEIVTGCATGVDACVRQAAEDYGIPLRVFYADWQTYGKAAGPVRNGRLVAYADRIVVIWDGRSRGSANVIKIAQRVRKDLLQIVWKQPPQTGFAYSYKDVRQ